MMDFIISKGSSNENTSTTKNLIMSEIKILNIVEIKSALISKVNGNDIFTKSFCRLVSAIEVTDGSCLNMKLIT